LPDRVAVDAPLALGSFDLCRHASNLLVDPLSEHAENLGSRDAERPQPPFGLETPRLGQRQDLRHRRINTLSEIPHTLAPDPTTDRDLAAC
jgi:hypothetical protein